MIIGFTGTQHGMTQPQQAGVHGILISYMAMFRGTLFCHGDCLGADAQAHHIAMNLGWAVIIFPPKNESKRAFCEGAVKVHEPDEYLARNRAIVNSCDVLIATPGEREEQLRSGTWSTVRYAASHKRNSLIVYPEGDIALREFTTRP